MLLDFILMMNAISICGELASFAQAQLYIDCVNEIDLENNRVICANRPDVGFDLLSIDIGSTPATISVPGATEYAIPAKPVGKLLQNWDELVEKIRRKSSKSGKNRNCWWWCWGCRVSLVNAGQFAAIQSEYRNSSIWKR